MLVLSVGMPKSGSAWYFNLTNDLLIASGFQDVRAVREEFQLHSILKYNTCNVQDLTQEKLAVLTSPPIADCTFVVKTHCSPNEYLLRSIEDGLVKPTYIYRDPRDVAVSGFEEGQKLQRKGRYHRGVTKLRNIEDAIYWSRSWINMSWDQWKNVTGDFRVRYEDLLANTERELERLSRFLNVEISNRVLNDIIDRYKPERLISRQDNRLHFNKGISGRFRHIMNVKELRLCKSMFGSYLADMGYSD